MIKRRAFITLLGGLPHGRSLRARSRTNAANSAKPEVIEGRAGEGGFLADAGSGNCSGMEEVTGAPSSLADYDPKRLRASGRDRGGLVNRPSKCASWSPLTLPCARKDRGARVSFGLAAGFHARRIFGNEGALMLFAERQGDAAIAETALSQIAERFKSLQTTASANLTFGVSRIFGFIDGKSASFARS